MISFDAFSSTDTNFTPASTLTVSHTVNAAANFLYASLVWWGTATVTTVAYAGVNMTQIGSTVSQTSAATTHGPFTQMNIAQFYKVSPATGANNLVATLSGNGNIVFGGISLYGVSTTNTINVSNTANGNGTTASLNLATTTNRCMSITTVCSDSFAVGALTAQNGQQREMNRSVAADSNGANAILSIQVQNVQPLSWDLGGTFNYIEVGAAILSDGVIPTLSYTPRRPHVFSPGLAR